MNEERCRKIFQEISTKFSKRYSFPEGVSQQFEKLKTEHKRKIRQEESSSGTCLEEPTKSKILLEDIIIQRELEVERERKKSKKKRHK